MTQPGQGSRGLLEKGVGSGEYCSDYPCHDAPRSNLTSVAREEQASKSMNHGSVYILVAEAKYLLL